jgi:hypothetical protein
MAHASQLVECVGYILGRRDTKSGSEVETL